MTFAILAAGEGSRLLEEGIATPKPLIKICGEALIDRLIRIFTQHGAERIVVVINSDMQQVKDHLDALSQQYPTLHVIVKNTPSSLHTLWEMSDTLHGETFILTTVDTIFDERAFTRYLRHGGFAVTAFVDDEKPLWVDTDEKGYITAFLDEGPCQYVSGGIYQITPEMMQIAGECVARGESRMRNFQRALLRAGISIKAFPMARIYDIDHHKDIEKAERFLSRHVLFVTRHPSYSKNESDMMIADTVGKAMQREGYEITYCPENDLTEELACRPWHVILSMARTDTALLILKDCNNRVINTPQSVALAAQRSNENAEPPCWVKRNGYTLHPNDVVFANTQKEKDTAIKEMNTRGIHDIVFQHHYEGKEVKFYGVGDTFFFPEHLPHLRKAATQAAHAAGLIVFGGDAILTREESQPADEITIIDLNDWPSFTPCRERAAEAICKIAEDKD